jgi:hypothetical protein
MLDASPQCYSSTDLYAPRLTLPASSTALLMHAPLGPLICCGDMLFYYGCNTCLRGQPAYLGCYGDVLPVDVVMRPIKGRESHSGRILTARHVGKPWGVSHSISAGPYFLLPASSAFNIRGNQVRMECIFSNRMEGKFSSVGIIYRLAIRDRPDHLTSTKLLNSVTSRSSLCRVLYPAASWKPSKLDIQPIHDAEEYH